MSYIGVVFSFVFVNNAIMSKMLGLPDSGNVRETRYGLLSALLLMGLCLASSMAGSGLWALTRKADFLFLPSFCLFFIGVIYAMEKLIAYSRAKASNALSVELRKIEASGIAFGIGALVARTQSDVLKAGIAAVAAVCGYVAANFLLAKIMERLELSDLPRPFRGTPAVLINAGLVSMAFMDLDQALLKNFFA